MLARHCLRSAGSAHSDSVKDVTKALSGTPFSDSAFSSAVTQPSADACPAKHSISFIPLDGTTVAVVIGSGSRRHGKDAPLVSQKPGAPHSD